MNRNRQYGNELGPITFGVVLLVCFASCDVHAATPAAKDFPSLKDACSPVAADSPVLAFEENAHFLCATVDLSDSLPDALNQKGSRALVRRIIFLKPSVWIIEDSVNPKVGEGALRWGVESQGDKGPNLTCEILWPAEESQPSTAEMDASGRCVRVFQRAPTEKATAPAKAVLENKDGRFDLTVTSADRIYRLQLPPAQDGTGRIAVNDAAGKSLVPLRPMPAGVLPHGPEGMKLLERWDGYYRDGRHPPWNSGMAAPDLRDAVEKGHIKPCRVAVLGCGSGDNSIYLAKEGFDVTAVDVAPTALSIAQTNAEKAGVKVKWLLADVLALPELQPFDLIFDRGCYHNVRYVDAKGFVDSVDGVSRPGTRFFVLSCDRDSAPGVREPTMRADFSDLFDFEWIRKSTIFTGKDAERRHASWSVMLRKKAANKAPE